MEEADLLGEDLVDYRASPEHSGMDVNITMLSSDCTIIGDDESVVAQFDFGPKEVAFTKPKESVNHLGISLERSTAYSVVRTRAILQECAMSPFRNKK
jgi:hypothetical protein